MWSPSMREDRSEVLFEIVTTVSEYDYTTMYPSYDLTELDTNVEGVGSTQHEHERNYFVQSEYELQSDIYVKIKLTILSYPWRND
jgi:hypothetical protein